MRKNRVFLFMMIVLSVGFVRCGTEPGEDSDGTDTSTGADGDADTDTDTDSDSETESETASDGPVEDLTSLIGRTYILEIPEGNWTQPVGVGSEIGGYMPNLIFEITNVSGNGFDTTMGKAKDGAQDLCVTTALIPGNVDDNPHFQIGPVDFDVIVEGAEQSVIATLHDMTITGVFTAEGTAFKKGTFSTIADFRDIYQLFTLLDNPTPDLICEKAPNMGFACEACPFDNQTYCISLLAENLNASDLTDLTLAPVEEMDESCLTDAGSLTE